MVYFIIIWVVIAFIYSKVKYEPFVKCFILLPFLILKAIFSIPTYHGNIKSEARKQGRNDILKKIDELERQQERAKKNINKTVNNIKKW